MLDCVSWLIPEGTHFSSDCTGVLSCSQCAGEGTSFETLKEKACFVEMVLRDSLC